MGWPLSPYYCLCQLTNVYFNMALRRNPTEADGTSVPRLRLGMRMLSYMDDDFILLANT